jgi:undecaprenyl phosphate N,N'-diacetylbacillosamine 1-phosphate transferase
MLSYKDIIKPIIDFLISLAVLIIASPICVLIMVFLLILNKGEVFFIQKRAGKNEKIFRIYKFQTMTSRRDSEGSLLPDNERITRFGRYLRKTSLDELPQLINVIKGDISLVGPRPLLVEYLEIYNSVQKRRHEVRPGITGWAQVNGRNAISWNEKFKLDVWYVDNISFFLDVKILFLTIKKVFKAENVNLSELTTMTRFTGNN